MALNPIDDKKTFLRYEHSVYANRPTKRFFCCQEAWAGNFRSNCCYCVPIGTLCERFLQGVLLKGQVCETFLFFTHIFVTNQILL